MEVLTKLCSPCLFGEDSGAKKLVEMTPFSNGSEKTEEESSMLPARARGWLKAAMAPVTTFQTHRAEESARRQKAATLQAGAVMNLITSRSEHAENRTARTLCCPPNALCAARRQNRYPCASFSRPTMP